MNVIDSWTGGRADALRRAFRMTIEDFAGTLGISPRAVAYWRQRPGMIQRPERQRILDTQFERAPDEVKARFVALIDQHNNALAQNISRRKDSSNTTDDINGLIRWITASNASNDAIERIEQAVTTVADRHTQAPAREVLADVQKLHGTTQQLLRGGRQRLQQTRDLLRVEGNVLAHASVLLGDLGNDQAAEDYGRAALLCLQEADASHMTAWYALAKTARWQHRYDAAADFARCGFEDGPINAMSVQLASYEANSAALVGDRDRARQALMRAESIAAAVPADESVTSLWAFPAERQAIFRLSVLLRTGDAAGALRTAAAADELWADAQPRIPGAWAQIRVGAAIAYLLQDSLDGAVDQVTPMLALAPQFRIATVTGWLRDLDAQLARPRFASSPTTTSLRQQICDFIADALPSSTGQESG